MTEMQNKAISKVNCLHSYPKSCILHGNVMAFFKKKNKKNITKIVLILSDVYYLI